MTYRFLSEAVCFALYRPKRYKINNYDYRSEGIQGCWYLWWIVSTGQKPDLALVTCDVHAISAGWFSILGGLDEMFHVVLF